MKLYTLLFTLVITSFVFGQQDKKHVQSFDVKEMRSVNSRTVANDDGTFSSTTFSQPIHYLNEGEWLPIDLSIKENNSSNRASYPFVNSDNSFQTFLPQDITSGLLTKFSEITQLVDMASARMYTESNGAIVGDVSYMNSSLINVKGNDVNYPEVYNGIDLNIQIENSRRKADYIIGSASFLNSIPLEADFLVFEEAIVLPNNWSAQLQEDRIEFSDARGVLQAAYDTPQIKDASPTAVTNLISNSLANDRTIFFSLVQEGTVCKVKIKVSIAWLRASERTFPVTVDPDLITGSAGPAFLYDQNYPSTSVRSLEMAVSTAPSNSVITNVDFKIYSAWAGDDNFLFNGGNPYSYQTYAVDAGWTSPKFTGSKLGTSVTNHGFGAAGEYSFSSDAFDGEEANQIWTVELVSTQYPWVIGALFAIEITFTAPDCSTSAAPSIDVSDETGLTNVSFNNIDNSTSGSSDLVSTGLSTDVCRGVSYPLSARVNTAGDWTVQVKAWIDWNNNGTYEESTEAYNLGTARNGTDIATSDPQTIMVPLDASFGNIPMRVVSAEKSTYPSACDNVMFGEIEDYTINIANPEITSGTDVTDHTTCGTSSLNVVVNTHDATAGGQWEPSNNAGLFMSATDANTSFTTNSYETPIVLTWTQNSGECINSTADITVKFNQPNTDALSGISMTSNCWLWGGLSNSESSTADNWYTFADPYWVRQTSQTPSSTDMIYILPNSSAGLCVSSTNNAVLSNVTITDLMVGNSAVIDLSGSLTMRGNLTNEGSINSGTSTLIVSGSSDQVLSGNELFLNNLTINKSSRSITASVPVNINGVLTMTSGNIDNGTNVLTIGSSSSNTGSISHTSGIVLGKLRRYFSNSLGSKFFPVGTSSDLRDVTVDFTAAPGSNQYLTASYNSGVPQLNSADFYEGLPLVTDDGQLIQNYDNAGIWEISPTNDDYNSSINSKSYEIGIHMNNLTGASDVSKVRVIKSAGSNSSSENHVYWSATSHLSSIGINTDFTVLASSMGFSFFGAGGDDVNNPLPVELVSFSGDCLNGSVDLFWQTASENNSEDFVIDYSRDGLVWNTIHSVEAAGFSSEAINYSFNHAHPFSGNNYYRLTQNDIDGAFDVYENLVINANCTDGESTLFSVFPNPSFGSFNMSLENLNLEGSATIKIMDVKGIQVCNKSIQVNSGLNLYTIREKLASGIYYISVSNGIERTHVVKHSVL